MKWGRERGPAEPEVSSDDVVMEAELDAQGAALERAALHAAAAGDSQQARARLYELLLGARVLVLTEAGPTTGRHVFVPGESLPLLTIEDGRVGTILLAFTRLAALRVFLCGQQRHYLVVGMKDLLNLVAVNDPNRNILINPSAPGTVALNAREIGHVARGRIPTITGGEVVAETQAQIAPVADLLPEPLLGALRAALSAHPDIGAAWAYRMRQGAVAPETVIGIGLAPGSTCEAKQAAVQGVIALATAACKEAGPLAYMAVAEDTRRMLEAGAGIELYRR